MLNKVLTGELTFTSLKPCDLSNCTKRQIKEYFENSYDVYESLFTSLKDDGVFYKCPDRLRLPLIFYYGHTASVYINKLVLSGLIKPEERVTFEYEKMFEAGVDEMSWDDVENYRMGSKFCWPTVDDVMQFRRGVRALILDVIERCEFELPVTVDSPMWALFMGMEHERIHLETSSVLIRQLPVELVRRPPSWKYGPTESRNGTCPLENPMITVRGGEVTVGKPWDFPSYGWDNEYGQTTITVPTFEAAKFPTTNAQFLEFVKCGGYRCREYWTNEGWQWVQYRQARHPTFWVCTAGCKSGCGNDIASYSHCRRHSDVIRDDADTCSEKCDNVPENYRLRIIFDVVDMPWNWPAEVNYHEAKAYCAWLGSGYRLMAEAEYNRVCGTTPDPSHGTSSDIIFHDAINANLNMQYGSSTPVDLYKPNNLGFHDVAGNVWQWVEDHFNGFPGFKTSYLYDDFSAPCFDGRHTVIKGGSWISTGDAASRFARYAFRRHFFQHLGFRLARSVTTNHNCRPVQLPVRVISTSVFVLGDGEQRLSLPFDPEEYSCLSVESTNSQYVNETEAVRCESLHSEYIGNGCSPATRLFAHCQQLLSNHLSTHHRNRALHVGCSTGRVTFELASLFDEVIGIDTYGRCIDAALKIQNSDGFEYTMNGKTHIAALNGDKIKKNVTFKQFTWIPNEVETFNFILCTYLHRVQNIRAWLVRLREILRTHGFLIIADISQYDVTDKTTIEGILGTRFQLIRDEQLETTSQLGTRMHITAWTKL